LLLRLLSVGVAWAATRRACKLIQLFAHIILGSTIFIEQEIYMQNTHKIVFIFFQHLPLYILSLLSFTCRLLCVHYL